MAFLSYGRRGDDGWLEWKVRLFSLAAILALAGIYTNDRRLTGVAITILVGAVLLRFLTGREDASALVSDDEDDAGETARG